MKRVTRMGVNCLLLMNSFVNVNAQNKNNSSKTAQRILYSVAVDGGIATGSLRDVYRYDLGGSISVDVPISNKFYATGSAGFQNFFYRENWNHGQRSTNGLQLLPLKAGLRYFPIHVFYVQGEAGAAFLLNKSSTDLNRSTAFIYAPQIGVQFQLVGNNWIDAGVRYERSSEFEKGEDDSKVNFLALKVAYTFAFGRRK